MVTRPSYPETRRGRPNSLDVPGGDSCVDLAHEADGLAEGDGHLGVVLLVGVGEGAALAVFEPLVADLVAADFEVPDVGGDVGEVLGLVDVDAVVFRVIADTLDPVVAVAR